MGRKRSVLAILFSVVLLWVMQMVRFGIDFFQDRKHLYIWNGCISQGPIACFLASIMEIVVAAWFLQRFALPALFGKEVFGQFESLKQQKLTGFVAQIAIRSACCVQLIGILIVAFGRETTLKRGLFPDSNTKVAWINFVKDGVAENCEALTDGETVALRAWFWCRYHMVSVHVWELSYIPGLTIDGWLHHLFVVLVAAVITQPDGYTTKPEVQPLIDIVSFGLVLGASLNWMVKSCVVMYHFTAPAYLTQAKWMDRSVLGAIIITAVFYFGIPWSVGIYHLDKFGLLYALMFIVTPSIFLVLVEIRLVIVKRSISRSARRKAEGQQDQNVISLQDQEHQEPLTVPEQPESVSSRSIPESFADAAVGFLQPFVDSPSVFDARGSELKLNEC
eukprot:TRINITY_DN14915_c0_g1_i1.p1 TRINITY_DN14915_c0_g1~~TRINITY_DN14915_c0_g1_i1.p1  ORF type:complete len:391 (-),score=59.30 TRINITY_DN14915_c0_g1_i1:130-1302(-)